ncbi:MAG: STN domain-containing protein [Bacteroidales bacterium]|jgi:hypothetical protein|nr:STN domain-containing protein [Bacteroidales bacterium]
MLFRKKNIRIAILAVGLFCTTIPISAQTTDYTLTLQVKETSLLEVFQSITLQTGLRFAYNTDILNSDTCISIDVVKEKVDTVLSLILPPSVKYKIRNNYIILTPENAAGSSLATRDTIFVWDTIYVYHDSIGAVLEEIKQSLHELKTTKTSSRNGNWIISLSSGFRNEICLTTNYSRAFWNNNLRLSPPSLELGFGYIFGNHLQIETGIKYIRKYADYSFEAFDWGGSTTINERHLLFSSLQFPLDMKYYMFLGRSNFSLLIKAGIDFSIPVNKKSIKFLNAKDVPIGVFLWESAPITENKTLQRLYYGTQIEAPLQRMNILLNLGTGISYQFPCGVGLSVYVEYYVGTANMARIAVPYRQEQLNQQSGIWEFYNEGIEYLTFREDCWNIGLTVSYTFKQKKTPQTTTK